MAAKVENKFINILSNFPIQGHIKNVCSLIIQ